LESEVFLLGHWKNYDELESNLSLDELMATLNASRDKEHRERKFLAAMQGVDIDEDAKEPGDVTALMNSKVAKYEGFGFNEGLGFMQQGV
jgi:hypothetical protein